MLLTGLTVLIIGASHLAKPTYLIQTLNEDLVSVGAKVHTLGVCGSVPTDWLKPITGTCGKAERINKESTIFSFGQKAQTVPLTELIEKDHPDLVIVVMGDTLASYGQSDFQRGWASKEVYGLTQQIKKMNVTCVWVGPGWGTEGGTSKKNSERVKQVSNFLATNTKPCTYINSLEMSQPGEWLTSDGQHYMAAGYQAWSKSIARELQAIQ